MMVFDASIVFGAGAIGSYLAARLSSKLPVTAVCRKKHAEAIRAHGLRMTGQLDESFRFDTAERLDFVPPRCLVLVTVKTFDTGGAAEALAAHVRDDTVVLCAQNGLDPESELRSRLNRKTPVLRAVPMMACNVVGPGEVEFWGSVGGGLLVEPAGARARRLADFLTACGIEASVPEDFPAAVWKKLAMNCLVNPLAALLHVRNREIICDELLPLRRALVSECVCVAKAEGVRLPGDIAEQIDEVISKSNNRCSMLQDIERGRRTEIEQLNARVVEKAREHGIATPANEMLTSLIRFLEP